MENNKIKVLYKERIDKYIANNSDISRNDVQKLIDDKQIFVNDIEVRKNKFVVDIDDIIEIKSLIDKEINIVGQDIPLNIIFENDDFVIINKPSGMVVHPAPGNYDNTLVNGLVFYFNNNLSDINGAIRPGIVHRIDKDTSGLLIVAKNNEAHNYLAELLKKHEVRRNYIAIIEGQMDHQITNVNVPIGRDINNRQKMTVTKINSKEAFTTFTVIDKNDKYSLIKCELQTGRTHQIRVHLAYINKPVYGDPVYGKKIDDFGQRLHAYEIMFTWSDGKEYSFNCPLPPEMIADMQKFNLSLNSKKVI